MYGLETGIVSKHSAALSLSSDDNWVCFYLPVNCLVLYCMILGSWFCYLPVALSSV